MKIRKYSAVFTLIILFATSILSANTPAPPDVAAAPDDAVKTDTGLATTVLKAGTGEQHPDAWDKVTVHSTGWTTDGTMFDSSLKSGEPVTFPLNRVIPGWTEGLQLMVVGERHRLWIPVQLAYNNHPNRPTGMLVFDVELLGIEDQPEPPEPPATPKNVTAPPANAEKSASGLASLVLNHGEGKEHPRATSTVTVHYSG